MVNYINITRSEALKKVSIDKHGTMAGLVLILSLLHPNTPFILSFFFISVLLFCPFSPSKNALCFFIKIQPHNVNEGRLLQA